MCPGSTGRGAAGIVRRAESRRSPDEVERSRRRGESFPRRRVAGALGIYARTVTGRVTWKGVTSRRGLLLVADGVAACAVSAVAVIALPDRPYTTSMWLALVTAVVAGATLAWRRIAPFGSVLVALAMTAACQRLSRQPLLDVPPFAIVLDTYLAAAVGFARGQWRRVALLGCLSLGTLVGLAAAAPRSGPGVVIQAALPVTVGPIVAGAVMAWRRNLAHRLDLTRALIADEQEMRVALSSYDERGHLARELHDVVAHAVTVMVIQAGAARVMTADGDTSGVRTRLERVVAAGREALADLRLLVAPARHADEQPDRGWSRLAELAARASEAGLPTDVVVVEATDGDVGSRVVHVVHRVVQEALTNAVKYAGGTGADVTLRSTGGALEVSIVNPLTGRPAFWTDAGGNGLTSMAERVRQNGGVLRAGPRPDGSFEVLARLPLGSDSTSLDTPRWRPPALLDSWQGSLPRRRYAASAILLMALELEVSLSGHRRGPLWENALIVAAMAAACLWRVARPLTTCLTVTVLAVPLSGGLTDITQATLTSTFVFVVPAYSVAAWAQRRRAVAGLAAVLAMLVGVGAWHHVGWAQLVDNLALTVLLWIVGRLVRGQRDLAARLETACEALLTERADRRRALAQLERDRIVSDLETSVLRDVTAMVALADRLLGDPPNASVEALASIETTGRSALSAMREIVGALRPGGDSRDGAPPEAVPV